MADEKEMGNKGEISDSEKLCNVMDALSAKMDSIMDAHKRLDARMDAVEEKREDRKDAETFEREPEGKEAPKADKRKDAEEGEDDEPKKDARRKDEEGEIEEPGEPEEPVADKRRKDSRRKDEDEDEERKDSRRRDSRRKDEDEEMDRRDAVADAVHGQLADLKAQIASLQARAPALINDADRERFASIQERADSAFQAFGDKAPAPLDGETPMLYRRRLAAKMQGHSPSWKDARLSAIADEAALAIAESQIYADAVAVAGRGLDVQPGFLREVSKPDGRGHIVNTFYGEPESWTRHFTSTSLRSKRAH